MGKVNIKKAKISDIQDILALSALFGTLKISFAKAQKTFEKFISSGFFTQFIAEKEGKIVGMIAVMFMPGFRDEEKLIGYLQRLVVSSDYRRQGISTALVKHAVKFCENKCYKVILHSQNDEAIKIYEKIGFKKHSTLLQLDFN